MSTTILLTGATGYIGGSILTELVKNPSYKITVLVRQAEQAKKIEASLPGVDTVIGSVEDLVLVERLATHADGALLLRDFSPPSYIHLTTDLRSCCGHCSFIPDGTAQGVHRRSSPAPKGDGTGDTLHPCTFSTRLSSCHHSDVGGCAHRRLAPATSRTTHGENSPAKRFIKMAMAVGSILSSVRSLLWATVPAMRQL